MTMSKKTKTGAAGYNAGFPGTNMTAPRLHPAITHISFTGKLSPEMIGAINVMAEKVYGLTKDDLISLKVSVKAHHAKRTDERKLKNKKLAAKYRAEVIDKFKKAPRSRTPYLDSF
jgi:hypothetical protein